MFAWAGPFTRLFRMGFYFRPLDDSGFYLLFICNRFILFLGIEFSGLKPTQFDLSRSLAWLNDVERVFAIIQLSWNKQFVLFQHVGKDIPTKLHQERYTNKRIPTMLSQETV